MASMREVMDNNVLVLNFVHVSDTTPQNFGDAVFLNEPSLVEIEKTFALGNRPKVLVKSSQWEVIYQASFYLACQYMYLVSTEQFQR